MERIIEHIECLLLQHDCIIIPDFGGFVLQAIPAEYLEADHLFTPARKEIVFNPTLTHNDGLLSESYMQRYSLDFARAQSLVRKDLAELKRELDDYSEIQLGSIGLFFKEEGRLVFMPAKHSDELFSVQTYGLPVYNFLPLSARDTVDMRSFLSSETKKKPETVKVDSHRKKVVYNIPVSRTFIQIAVASAAAILLFLFLTTPVSDVNKASYSASFVPHEVMPKKTAEEISMNALLKNDEINTNNSLNNEEDTTTGMASITASATASDNETFAGLSTSPISSSETATPSSTPTTVESETATPSSTPITVESETASPSSTPITVESETATSSSALSADVSEIAPTTSPAPTATPAPAASPAPAATSRLSTSTSRLSTSTSRLSTSSSRLSSATTGGKRYYVIIGSFNTRAQAQRHINSLKGIDTKNTGILVRDGHVRVYAQIFSSQKEAQLYQKILNIDSWIYSGQ